MRAAAVALGLGSVLAFAACDWREFDDLKKQTPVAAITAPSNYAAKDQFGSILLAVPPPKDGSAAGRFVATATSLPAVAVVSFDAAGNQKGVGVTGMAIDNLYQSPITAIALIPDARSVIMGAPFASYGDVVTMDLDATTDTAPYPTHTFASAVTEPQYGVGVGAGPLGGGAAADYVVLSATRLHVYVDGLLANDKAHDEMPTGDPCPITFSSNLPDRDRVARPVIVDSLTGAGTQIAVGTPAVTGVGHVSIFSVDVAANVFTCAATLTGTEPHFGRAMALVDLVGGDGEPDHLLVGAPSTHAYLYALPLSTGQAPVMMVTDSMGSDFGAAVAAFDIDGKAGDEMFIGNPDAAAGGTMNAGHVTIYTGTAMTMLPQTFPNPLGEHDPGAGHGYGSGIAGMMFCPGNVLSPAADGGAGTGADGGIAPCAPLPMIGSLSKVYAYFTLKKPDPRVR
jgi:hypothetical protein